MSMVSREDLLFLYLFSRSLMWLLRRTKIDPVRTPRSVLLNLDSMFEVL